MTPHCPPITSYNFLCSQRRGQKQFQFAVAARIKEEPACQPGESCAGHKYEEKVETVPKIHRCRQEQCPEQHRCKERQSSRPYQSCPARNSRCHPIDWV